MSRDQYRKMKSSKVNRHDFFSCVCHMSGVTQALLGICVFLFEIRQSQEASGLSWSATNNSLIRSVKDMEASSTHQSLANNILADNYIGPETPEADGVPEFHSPSVRLTVKQGDLVKLPCKIHNLGNDHVVWRHGNNILAGTNVTTYADQRIQLLSDLTLEITNITRDDQGEYECILSGAFPRPGLTHSLIVHDAPTVSLTTPTQLTVMEGENVEIGCIPHGNPLPRITWSMRDVQTPIPIPNSMLHKHRITLEKVTSKHNGLYVCEADNGVGRPAIGAVYVRVLYTPEIETPKRRVHGGVGFKAELVCIVRADPPADVKWLVGQQVVNMSDRIYTENLVWNEYSLVFNPVQTYDFNSYTCEANNSRGFNRRHIDFTGVPNPPVINSWETQILVKGTLSGDRTTEMTMIEEEISVTLFWKVECKSSLIDYRLHFRPDIRNEITGITEDRSPPWMELTIPADQSSASFLHTKTFTLRGLQPSTIYEAAIKARNKHGWSHLSEVCYFSTFPNSSSARQEEIMVSIKKWRDSIKAGDGKRNEELPTEKEVAEFTSGQSRVGPYTSVFTKSLGWLLLSLLSVICKYSV